MVSSFLTFPVPNRSSSAVHAVEFHGLISHSLPVLVAPMKQRGNNLRTLMLQCAHANGAALFSRLSL
jgi:hypothetical protein